MPKLPVVTAVHHYAPGEQVREASYKPGDFILVHGQSLAPRLIRAGQSFRFRGADRTFSFWNHVALIVGPGQLVEAKGSHGVREVPMSYYDDRWYAIVKIKASETDRKQMVAFARSQVGNHYGYVNLLSTAAWALTGGKLVLSVSGTEICSGLVAMCLERAGWIFANTVTTMPATLAKMFDIRGHDDA